MAYFQASSPAAHETFPDLPLEPNPDDYNHEPRWTGVTGDISMNFLNRNTSARRPSPWTDYPPFSPPMNTFGPSAFDQEAHLSSESLVSLHTSSGCSSQKNSFFEREPYCDSSTPGTAHNTISPSPTLSSRYSDTYVQYPLLPHNPTLDMNYGGDGYGMGYTGCDQIGAVEPSATVTAPDASYLASMSGPQTSMNADLTFDLGCNNVDMLTDGSMGDLDSNNGTGKRSTSRKLKSSRIGKSSPKLSKQSSGRIEKPSSGRGRPSANLAKSKTKICSTCNASFKDNQSLEKHVKTKHTRPFICIFHYAGCDADFASKNEWKRHVVSQHLYLEYYHCQYAECENAKPPSSQYRCSTLPQLGGVFNRKDLFTQHIRRMHQSKDPKQMACAIREDQIKSMQDSSRQTRCELPQLMYCPADGCHERFVGQRAWDDRMEHVARHLERAAEGMEPRLSFGGSHDTTLNIWAESPAVNVVRRVNGGWKLRNPIRQKGDDDMSNVKLEESEEDAEGEDNFTPGMFEHPLYR